MVTLKYKNKVIGLLSVLTVLQHGCGLYFFYLQGIIIHNILAHTTTIQPLLHLLGSLIFLKIIMVALDLSSENLKDQYASKEFDYQFINYFPSFIYKDIADKHSLYFNIFSQNIPILFSNTVAIAVSSISFCMIIISFITLLLISHFYLGGFIIAFLIASIFLNQALYGKKMTDLFIHLEKSRQHLIKWIHHYFLSFREISHCWCFATDNKKWFNSTYALFSKSKRIIIRTLFIKNISSQLLVEIPFISVTAVILLGVFKQSISFPIAFAWIGLSQFILTAAKNISRNHQLSSQRNAASRTLDQFISTLNTKPTHPLDSSEASTAKTISAYPFALLNNDTVQLGTQAKQYIISASNGTGKTTLIDTLIDYDRLASYNNSQLMRQLKDCFPKQSIRVIDNAAILFDSLTGFEQQISGPIKTVAAEHAFKKISNNLSGWLGQSTIYAWINILENIKQRYEARVDKRLSQGETVLLSFARSWYSWHPDIKLLILDECDAPLDASNRSLVLETLSQLSQKITIFNISHRH
jgi:ABC-type molybdenum transport system ATPase subunit/photorepair protein PhrA